MFYWKYSPNRIFFINEYWIFIPLLIGVDYVIIKKIQSNKEQVRLLKKLKNQIERQRRITKILALSLGLNACGYLFIRGGQDFIDVDYIDCSIEDGLSFLDSARLRNVIHDLYSNKRKARMIYITATAVCHLSKQYGQMFPAVPFAIGDFGMTSIYQTARKLSASILLSAVAPLLVGGGIYGLIAGFILATLGLKIAFKNLDSIPVTPIDLQGSIDNLKTRISGVNDVVVVNFRNKITMSDKVNLNKECWLADQALLNSKCRIDPTDVIDLVPSDLNYDDVVNMQDVTGLDRVDFSDRFDIGEVKSSIIDPSPSDYSNGKMVNFLDKFGDSSIIDEKDTWDTNEFSTPQRNALKRVNDL